MSDKLRCEIVQDLLPSYVDGLTSGLCFMQGYV